MQLWWTVLYVRLIWSHAIRFSRQCDEQAGEISNVRIPLRGQEGLRLVVMVLVFGIGHIRTTFQAAEKCVW